MAIWKVERSALGDGLVRLERRAEYNNKEIQDVIFEILCEAFQYTPSIKQSPHPKPDKKYIYIGLDTNLDSMLIQYHILRREPLKLLIPNIILEHYGLLPVDSVWIPQQIRMLCRILFRGSPENLRGKIYANRDSENSKFQH
jgi:hypothetical protein